MQSLRKVIFWAHLVCGVAAGLIILLMSATGVLLTYEKQMLLWADTRNYQILVPPGTERLPIEDLLLKVQAAQSATPTGITVRSDQQMPVAVSFDHGRTVYANPYTGAVLGEGAQGTRNFFRIVTNWHRWLGTEGAGRATGRMITGVCNLAFLLIVASGLYLWFPRFLTWAQFKNILWFRRGLSGKARDFNWHNVIGFWSLNSQVPYSGLLLTVGLFYGVLSVMKRSLGLGLLAALTGNSGLWHFLNRVEGLTFFEHPQLWLIPAAVSVLLAARINRESLSVEQMNSIRYGALVTIYVSSTADIFINGVDNAPWLPIVLAVLAVGGVVAGLMMRIRAFLFLGTAFLLLSMLTMIWSASVNLQWTWLWYVTGIAFGVLIIYTVAMFERKREQMIGFVERLKQWQ